MTTLLEVEALRKRFAVRRGLLQRVQGWVHAVDGVDLSLAEGECLGIVGESGSGKTTLGRCIVRLYEVGSGSIRLLGEELGALRGEALRRRRRLFQMIFQDPYGSLNPRMRVGRTLAEPLEVHGIAHGDAAVRRVEELLGRVGLSPSTAESFPHQLSGGQRQRVCVARALATEPRLLVADEPVSALDVSVQAQIVNLLVGLQDELGLGLLFIAHDLGVVEQIAHRVSVMYLGRIVETASTARLFADPQHPYTVSLASAAPRPVVGGKRQRIVLRGEAPSPAQPPSGCRFHPRCPIARERCARDDPALRSLTPGHAVACHYPGELRPSAKGDPAAEGTDDRRRG